MLTRASPPRAPRVTFSSRRGLWALAVVATAFVAAVCAAAGPVMFRVGLAMVVTALLVVVASRSPVGMVHGLTLWMFGLGLIRRLADQVTPRSEFDVLLLVGPAVLLVLAAQSVREGALRRRTPLTTLVAILVLALALASFNPAQGDPLLGLSGAFLLVPPLLMFFVGRSLVDDDTLRRHLTMVAVLAVIAGAYGLFQIHGGFPSWDQDWIDQFGYVALHIGATVRAFGPFSAASEYGLFLGLGLVAIVGLYIRERPRWWSVTAAGFLLLALVFHSGRLHFVLTIVGISVAVAARRGWSAVQIGGAGLVMLVAIVIGAQLLAPAPVGGGQGSQDLVAHQVNGLARPFDPDHSTVSIHQEYLVDAFSVAFSQPLGAGPGVVTPAAFKLGAEHILADHDIATLAVSLGVLGIVLYLAVLVAAFGSALDLLRVRRSALAATALGVLILTFSQWFAGGNYAVAFQVWLVLGWIDGARQRHLSQDRAEQHLPTA